MAETADAARDGPLSGVRSAAVSCWQANMTTRNVVCGNGRHHPCAPRRRRTGFRRDDGRVSRAGRQRPVGRDDDEPRRRPGPSRRQHRLRRQRLRDARAGRPGAFRRRPGPLPGPPVHPLHREGERGRRQRGHHGGCHGLPPERPGDGPVHDSGEPCPERRRTSARPPGARAERTAVRGGLRGPADAGRRPQSRRDGPQGEPAGTGGGRRAPRRGRRPALLGTVVVARGPLDRGRGVGQTRRRRGVRRGRHRPHHRAGTVQLPRVHPAGQGRRRRHRLARGVGSRRDGQAGARREARTDARPALTDRTARVRRRLGDRRFRRPALRGEPDDGVLPPARSRPRRARPRRADG